MTVDAATNIMPFLTTVGFGGIVGFLVGLAIKYVIKILAIVAGLFFAALMYLQSQGILNINWDKLQTMSQPILSTLANNLNSTAAAGQQQQTIHNNQLLLLLLLPFLPIDMGLPLAGSAGLGFILGLTRG
jgi:uncharacterized membrane protein (Fun14 family)